MTQEKYDALWICAYHLYGECYRTSGKWKCCMSTECSGFEERCYDEDH
jgi:hypothetical protein